MWCRTLVITAQLPPVGALKNCLTGLVEAYVNQAGVTESAAQVVCACRARLGNGDVSSCFEQTVGECAMAGSDFEHPALASTANALRD